MREFSHWNVLIACIVIFLALSIRFWKIEYIPYANDADELAYIWAGQSLVEFGVPISWSSFQHTDTQWHWTEIQSEVVQDSKVPIAKFVKPWFDHSFVLPLLMGSWSELLGYHFPSIPPALFYRLPFLVIAGVNLGLIYLIARKMFGQWPALFALSLASFSPTFVFAQRMVVSENLLATFLLTTIYLFLTDQPLWSLILATAFAGLVKLPGLSIVPVIGIAMLSERKVAKALQYGVGVAAVVAFGYGVYGAHIDWNSFTAAMRDQSSRLLGWSNPAFLFSQPGFHTKAVLDMSYYVLLLCGFSVYFLPFDRSRKVLSGSILSVLLTVWVTSAEQDMLGWYKIPLFCVLAIGSAGVFTLLNKGSESQKESNSVSWSVIVILLSIMVVNNLGIVRFPAQPLPEAQLLRLVVGGILLLGLGLLYVKVPQRLYQCLVVGLLCMYALESFFIADKYFAASCKDRNCPTPYVTFTQTVRSVIKR